MFDATTALQGEKRTVLVRGKLGNDFSGTDVEGYKIHMGVTEHFGQQRPFAQVCEWGSDKFIQEGHTSSDGRHVGTYLHGILHDDQFRTMWLNRIRTANGMPAAEVAGDSARLLASLMASQKPN